MSDPGEPKTRCPGWLLNLVVKVESYESIHGPDESDCFDAALRAVPAEVRAQAAGYVVAQREREEGA
jgi:hypothetical protein